MNLLYLFYCFSLNYFHPKFFTCFIFCLTPLISGILPVCNLLGESYRKCYITLYKTQTAYVTLCLRRAHGFYTSWLMCLIISFFQEVEERGSVSKCSILSFNSFLVQIVYKIDLVGHFLVLYLFFIYLDFIFCVFGDIHPV